MFLLMTQPGDMVFLSKACWNEAMPNGFIQNLLWSIIYHVNRNCKKGNMEEFYGNIKRDGRKR